MFTTRIEEHPTDHAALVVVVIIGGRRRAHEVRDPAFVEAVTAAGKVGRSTEQLLQREATS